MTSDYDSDHINRTALLHGRQSGDAEQGARRHGSSRALILAGSLACSTRSGQAAILTAVKTSVRAFGHTEVVLAVPNQHVLGGPSVGVQLGRAVMAEGASVTSKPSAVSSTPALIIGDCPANVLAEPTWLKAYWTSWTATVTPVTEQSEEEPPCDGNVLAAIAAAALAVAELFFVMTGEAGSGFGARHVELDLWSPDGTKVGPAKKLSHAPARWWLLGLGHLGQGYAHAISWLDYIDPAEVEVVLQDTQRTVPANHSTGLLTPAGSEGVKKTRIVAEALDRCGLDTVVIERLMSSDTPALTSDKHVALIGVDNLRTRRQIDAYGWDIAIDVGLGAGVMDFDGLTVFRFPGRKSSEIPAWQEGVRGGPTLPRPAMTAPGLDSCGLAELEGVAVGASFVGALAGAVAVAEALRSLNGGLAYAVGCYALREDEFDGSRATVVSSPVAVSLRT